MIGHVLFLHPEEDWTGRAFWRDADGAWRPVLDDSTAVRSVCAYRDAVWIGTKKGVLVLRDGRWSRVSPQNWEVRDIAIVDDRLWLRTSEGVFASDGEDLIRITEPCVQVDHLVRTGESVWLVQPLNWMDRNVGGPALRVDGWSAVELPARSTRIGTVLDSGRAAWLASEQSAYRWCDHEVTRVDGLATYLDAVVEVGSTAYVTTHEKGLMAKSGPAYRIDVRY